MRSGDDEGSVCGAGFNPEGREPAGGRPPRPKAPRGPLLDLDLGLPRSSEGFESASSEGMAAEGRVLWGREGRPGCPAAIQGHVVDYLAEEAATAVLQQLTNRDALGVRRNPSPESGTMEVPTVWLDLEPGPRGRGVRAQSWVGSQPLTSAAAQLHLRAPEGGWAWGGLKRGAKGPPAGTGDPWQRSAESLVMPTSDSESSDEIDITQLMRVTISHKGLASPRSSESPGGAPRHPSTNIKEGSLQVPGPCLFSSPRGLPSAVGEQEAAASKKTPSVVWGKVESSRPSYVVGAAAAAPSGLLMPTPWKKALQEKRSLGKGSNPALGRGFPSCGQRVPAPPPAEAVTFPTISAVPLLARSKKPSWAPGGTKQFKHTSGGKKSVPRRTRESEPMTEEDNGGKGDRASKGQVSIRPHAPSVQPSGCPRSGTLRLWGATLPWSQQAQTLSEPSTRACRARQRSPHLARLPPPPPERGEGWTGRV